MKTVIRYALWMVVASGVAAADEVTDWNRITLDALLVPPAVAAPLAQRPAAIVQAAVFDAVNGIERRYTPIHVTPQQHEGHHSAPRQFKRPMRVWYYCFLTKRQHSTNNERFP